MNRTLLAVGALALFSVCPGSATAKETALPSPLKTIASPFALALVGRWETHGSGTAGTDKGVATLALGIGGTSILEDYSTMRDDGMAFSAHGVYRVSEDARGIALWWYTSYLESPIEWRGYLSASSATLQEVVSDAAKPSLDRRLLTIQMVDADHVKLRMVFGATEQYVEEWTRRR